VLRAGWPARVKVLGVIVVALMLALAVTGLIVSVAANQLRGEAANLRADAAKRQEAQAQVQKKRADDYQQADLSGKLQRVRDLTNAANQTIITWAATGQQATTIKTVRDARNKCDEAVLDYDATAAQFPPSMLAGLPPRIDIKDNATDCGRPS
jgi:uncharacterized iron-regulated membrane protein